MFLDYAQIPGGEEYPFSCLGKIGKIGFGSRVTVFCGGNGQGKSTLLRVLAQKSNCYSVGEGRAHFSGGVLSQVKTGKTEHAADRFYFSAEEFLEYVLRLKQMKSDARSELDAIDREGKFRGAAKGFASMPYARTIHEIENMYGRELTVCSHGEGFLEFFKSRVHPAGLYFLDEPESALSYENQYRLEYMMDELKECQQQTQDGWFISGERAKEGCQFFIATHSPVLPLIPGAEIFQLKDGGAERKTFDELTDIAFLRMFLARKGEKMFD